MSRKVESSAVFCFCTILKSIKYNHSFIGGCKKRGCFAVKLTIWVDPTPLTVSFRYFFCVFDLIVLLVLESRIPPYCCCSVTMLCHRQGTSPQHQYCYLGLTIWYTILYYLSFETKCVLSVKESSFPPFEHCSKSAQCWWVQPS